MRTTQELIHAAWNGGLTLPAFNIPYLPMMEPVMRALRDGRCFGLIAVARPEIIKFEARSLQAIRDEYSRVGDPEFSRLHLDHTPVIDEDNQQVDYRAMIAEALELGYSSVMVDGSRLPLADNIAATKAVVDMAHARGIAVEGELGAVLGHEEGPLPPYEELFASGKGFTDPKEAKRFVKETGVDWLSVAIGNIHGAISQAKRGEKKVEARLSLPHLRKISRLVNIPLVLHGGSGIRQEDIRQAIRLGIAKINIGTTIRQAYEAKRGDSVEAAQEAVYQASLGVIRDELDLEGSAERINP